MKSYRQVINLISKGEHSSLSGDKCELCGVVAEFEKSPIPTVVCLCGSTRFKEHFESAMRDETLKGNIVLSVGLFGHMEGLDMSGDTKKMLDELHLHKIDMADEVLVINIGDYIGESTAREICYAQVTQKPVRFLEPHLERMCPYG